MFFGGTPFAVTTFGGNTVPQNAVVNVTGNRFNLALGSVSVVSWNPIDPNATGTWVPIDPLNP